MAQERTEDGSTGGGGAAALVPQTAANVYAHALRGTAEYSVAEAEPQGPTLIAHAGAEVPGEGATRHGVSRQAAAPGAHTQPQTRAPLAPPQQDVSSTTGGASRASSRGPAATPSSREATRTSTAGRVVASPPQPQAQLHSQPQTHDRPQMQPQPNSQLQPQLQPPLHPLNRSQPQPHTRQQGPQPSVSPQHSIQAREPVPGADGGSQAAERKDAAQPAAGAHTNCAQSTSEPAGAHPPPQPQLRTQPQAKQSAKQVQPQPHPHPYHEQPKSYAALYTAHHPPEVSPPGASAAGSGASGPTQVDQQGQNVTSHIEISGADADGQVRAQRQPGTEQQPGTATGADGDEPDLIARLEAEAVQLGLGIYARDGAGAEAAGEGSGTGSGDGAGPTPHLEDDGTLESLEAIMALGRKPEEIADLILAGCSWAGAGHGAGGKAVAGAAGTGTKAERQHNKGAAREAKRALRSEQRQQQRQSQQALLGLQPPGGEAVPEGDGAASTSSVSDSDDSDMEGGCDGAGGTVAVRGQGSGKAGGADASPGRRASDLEDGGTIKAFGNPLLLLPQQSPVQPLPYAAGSGALGSSDLALASDDQNCYPRELNVEAASAATAGAAASAVHDDDSQGRILTSAGAAAALGLLFGPSPPASGLRPPSEQPPYFPPSSGASSRTPPDVLGTSLEYNPTPVPSYLYSTPPAVPRESDGLGFQPHFDQEYPPSIAPTASSEGDSTLHPIDDARRYRAAPMYGSAGGSAGLYGSDSGSAMLSGVSDGFVGYPEATYPEAGYVGSHLAGGPQSGGGVGEVEGVAGWSAGDRQSDSATSASAAGGAAAAASYPEDDHEAFLAAREERSRSIAAQLAALQEESRQLQEQSVFLQERTREISRNAGMATPPLPSSATPRLSDQPVRPPPLPPPAAGATQPSSAAARDAPGRRTPPRPPNRQLPSANGAPPHAAASAAAARHAGVASAGPEGGRRSAIRDLSSPDPSARATVSASALQDPAIPYAGSRPISEMDFDGRTSTASSAPLPLPAAVQGAPINWALPNRNLGPPASSQSSMRAFPSPPRGARRMLDSVGSSSSFMESMLPRWADQVASPVGTPVDRQLPDQWPSQPGPGPGPWGPSGDGTAAGPVTGPPGLAPKPLMQHVAKGRSAASLAPVKASGKAAEPVKSRLGAGAAAGSTHTGKPPQPLPQHPPQQQQQQPQQHSPIQQPMRLPPGMYDVPPGAVASAAAMPPTGLQQFPPGLPPDGPGGAQPGGWGPGVLLGGPPQPVMAPGLGPGGMGPAAGMAAIASGVATQEPTGQGGAARQGRAHPGLPKPPRLKAGPAASTAKGKAGGGEDPGQAAGGASGQMMPLGPPGVMPVMLSPYGALMQPIGPWMGMPSGPQLPHNIATVSPTGAAAAGAANVSPGRGGRNAPPALPVAKRGPGVKGPPVPDTDAMYGGLPFGLPMAMMGAPGFMGFSGAAGSFMPWMPGAGAAVMGPSQQQQQQPWQPEIVAGNLPPVKLQRGKGKMSRSAPPGGYAGGAGTGVGVPVSNGGMVPSPAGGMAGGGMYEVGNGLTAAQLDPIGAGLWAASGLYGMMPAPAMTEMYVAAAAAAAGGAPGANAAAILKRASAVQQQQLDHYRDLEANLLGKLDRQQGVGAGGKGRRLNSHDGRPAFRLF